MWVHDMKNLVTASTLQMNLQMNRCKRLWKDIKLLLVKNKFGSGNWPSELKYKTIWEK